MAQGNFGCVAPLNPQNLVSDQGAPYETAALSPRTSNENTSGAVNTSPSHSPISASQMNDTCFLSDLTAVFPETSQYPHQSTEFDFQNTVLDPFFIPDGSLHELEVNADLDNMVFVPDNSLSWDPSCPSFQSPSWEALSRDISSQNPTNSALQLSLQLVLSQNQSLMIKVQALEASLSASERKIDEFSQWSKKMEKHSQETSSIILNLFDTVKNPEFLRSVLHQSQGKT